MPNSPLLLLPMVEDTCKILIESHDGDENEIDGEPSTDRGGATEKASEGAGKGVGVVGEVTKFQ